MQQARDGHAWKGDNILGQALMQVRSELQAAAEEREPVLPPGSNRQTDDTEEAGAQHQAPATRRPTDARHRTPLPTTRQGLSHDSAPYVPASSQPQVHLPDSPQSAESMQPSEGADRRGNQGNNTRRHRDNNYQQDLSARNRFRHNEFNGDGEPVNEWGQGNKQSAPAKDHLQKAAYSVKIMRIASEGALTPWKIPSHHQHSTLQLRNCDVRPSNAKFQEAMTRMGMSPQSHVACTSVHDAAGNISASKNNINAGDRLDTLCCKGDQTVVIWDAPAIAEDAATTLLCESDPSAGPRAQIFLQYATAGKTPKEELVNFGFLRIGCLTDGEFTVANQETIESKLREWSHRHFSKNKDHQPRGESHITGIHITSHFGNRAYVWTTGPTGATFKDTLTGECHTHPKEIIVYMSLTMMDTTTLLHEHMPRKKLQHIHWQYNYNRNDDFEAKVKKLQPVVDRIAQSKTYSASDLCTVDKEGNTRDRSIMTNHTVIRRSDTECGTALLRGESVVELLQREDASPFLAAQLVDWVSCKHHQINNNGSLYKTSLYERDAIANAVSRTAPEAPEPEMQAGPRPLSDLQLLSLQQDLKSLELKRSIRAQKLSRHLKAFIKRLKELDYEQIPILQDEPFKAAAILHHNKVTEPSDIKLKYYVLTSIMVGMRAANVKAFTTWRDRILCKENNQAEVWGQLLTHEPHSPAYYMLGWHFTHERTELQRTYGQNMSCTGSSAQGGDCKMIHTHGRISKSNCASTGWIFKQNTDGTALVAIGIHSKKGNRMWMGHGGKPDAKRIRTGNETAGSIPQAFADLCIASTEDPLCCIVRECLEETDCLINPARWATSWMGIGNIGKKWQLIDYATYLQGTDSLVGKESPFEGCEEFELSKWASEEDIALMEQLNNEGEQWDPSTNHATVPPKTDRLVERVAAAAAAAGIPWDTKAEPVKLPETQPVEAEAAQVQNPAKKSKAASAQPPHALAVKNNKRLRNDEAPTDRQHKDHRKRDNMRYNDTRREHSTPRRAHNSNLRGDRNNQRPNYGNNNHNRTGRHNPDTCRGRGKPRATKAHM